MSDHHAHAFSIGGYVAPPSGTPRRRQPMQPRPVRPSRSLPASLDGSGLFRAMSRRTRRAAQGFFTAVTVPPGRALMRQGDRGLEFVVLLDGEATVARDGEVVARITTGDHVGEIALLPGLTADGCRTATVTTERASSIAVCNRYEFRDLLDLDADVRRRVEDRAHELVS